jgi:hypothetical protein
MAERMVAFLGEKARRSESAFFLSATGVAAFSSVSTGTGCRVVSACEKQVAENNKKSII